MRKAVIIVSMVIIAGLFVACGSGPSSTIESRPESSHVSGTDSLVTAANGELVIGCGLETQADALDPVYEDGGIIRIEQIAFEGLVRPNWSGDGDVEIKPLLAESWQITDYGMRYTFKLKHGVKFADGKNVTVEDWIWSLERARDYSQGPWSSYASKIDSVTAIDADTIEIRLDAGDASFLSALALPCFAVQSKAASDMLGHDEYLKSPMGTGAFYFDGWKNQEYYHMSRNPYYHGEKKIDADSLNFVYIADEGERVKQLKEGSIDICLDTPANRAAELESGGFIVDVCSSAEQRYVNFNVTKPPFDNAKVRRALRMATDREKIVKTAVMGQGEPSYNAFSSSGMYFDRDAADEGYDIDKAAALLAEAGYPDGFETKISFIADNAVSENIAVILNEEWGKIGVKLTFEPMEAPEYIERLGGLEYSVTTLRWADETVDPAGFADFISNREFSMGFYTGYYNPRVTDLSAAGHMLEEDGEAKREAAYREMQRIICDEAPFYPLYRTWNILAAKSGADDFEQTPFGLLVLTDN